MLQREIGVQGSGLGFRGRRRGARTIVGTLTVLSVCGVLALLGLASSRPALAAKPTPNPTPTPTPTPTPCPTIPPVTNPPYTITDLGTFGGTSGEPRGLNNAGQVVGRATSASGVWRAFLWENGVMQDLGTLGGASSFAWAINDAGQVVGSADGTDGSEPFLWQDGAMESLGTLGGAYNVASSINSLGQAAGWSKIAGNRWKPVHAFIWDPGTGMNDLGAFAPEGDSYAYGINDAGIVVGTPGVWKPGASSPIDLGTLGGARTTAWAVDNRGRVVGYSLHANGTRRPILVVPEDTDGDGTGDQWFRDTNADGINDLMLDLGTLGGAGGSEIAWMIHSTGKIVGRAHTALDLNCDGSQDEHAFLLVPEDTNNDGVPDLWFRDAGDGITNALMSDLNAVTSVPGGWVLTEAHGVNDSGQIIAMGRLNGNTTSRAFLLTPLATP